jgi:hypothetical protein
MAGVLGGLALTAIPAASAQAAIISTGACDGAALSQPFAHWGDKNVYKLVPGGDFESSLSGWTFGGGARTVAGSEPDGVTGNLGSSSLSLPAGASAQTPFTCVNAAYPTFRFFGRNNGLLSSVLVSVVYRDPILGTVTLPVGTVALSGSWQPTQPMLTASAVEGALSGGTAQMALRFTAIGGGSQIDDIFIDPRGA